jgi:hypothetical protein
MSGKNNSVSTGRSPSSARYPQPTLRLRSNLLGDQRSYGLTRISSTGIFTGATGVPFVNVKTHDPVTGVGTSAGEICFAS